MIHTATALKVATYNERVMFTYTHSSKNQEVQETERATVAPPPSLPSPGFTVNRPYKINCKGDKIGEPWHSRLSFDAPEIPAT
jgi:hypothetical protein